MKLKQLLKQLNACKEAIEWLGDKTIEQAVAECHRGDWLLWLASRASIDQRKLFLAKGLCANTVRHLMKDKRSTAAVDAAIAYGKGDINDVELENAADAAHAAYFAADDAAAYAACVTADAAYAACVAADAAYAAYFAADDDDAYAACVADDAAYAACVAADDDDARIENQAKTAGICREVFAEELINKVNEALCPHE